MQLSQVVQVGAISAVVAVLASWAVNRVSPPQVDVVQRVDVRRTMGTMGGTFDSMTAQNSCQKDCAVKVTPTVDVQGTCVMKVDFGVVHPKKNQQITWTLPASAPEIGTKPNDVPKTYYFKFHRENGIQVLGNLALEGDASNHGDKLIVDCARESQNPLNYQCTSSNANVSSKKHQTKAMAYNIIVWYDTKQFDPPPSNPDVPDTIGKTSQLCVLDPVIVNRGG